VFHLDIRRVEARALATVAEAEECGLGRSLDVDAIRDAEPFDESPAARGRRCEVRRRPGSRGRSARRRPSENGSSISRTPSHLPAGGHVGGGATTLISRADAALYRVKAHARNCVRVSVATAMAYGRIAHIV
jgi:hypothetical protein